MARSPNKRKLRSRRKTGKDSQPDSLLLTTNNERRLAAAAMARRSFEDQPRGPDGRWVEGKLVTLPEPRGDMTDRPTTDLDWAFSGTGPDSDAEPVTLMQPFVHPREVVSYESASELPLREFVARVTPEVERPVSFIDEVEKEVRRQWFKRWLPRALAVFLIVILFGSYLLHILR